SSGFNGGSIGSDVSLEGSGHMTVGGNLDVPNVGPNASTTESVGGKVTVDGTINTNGTIGSQSTSVREANPVQTMAQPSLPPAPTAPNTIPASNQLGAFTGGTTLVGGQSYTATSISINDILSISGSGPVNIYITGGSATGNAIQLAGNAMVNAGGNPA